MELIKGVALRQLRINPDERGYLVEMLRRDWPEFMQFAQAYATSCYPGIYKAWHYHKKQWDHFACPWGMARVVLYDARKESPSAGEINVFHIGLLNPVLLRIPPMVYHGFTAEGSEPALVVNFPTELYNYQEPDEYRLPWDDPSIPYRWEEIHG